jgi:hypothetical protein
VILVATNLVQTIKAAAREERVNARPCDVLFGTVESPSPLRIKVEQRLTLPAEFLALTSTAKNAGLSAGDKVALLRKEGGQLYVVLDKLV